MVLVTDGNEISVGRPGELAATLRATARDLTVHVVGFRAMVDFFGWNIPEQDPEGGIIVARCLADETGGLFVRTKTVEQLVAAWQKPFGCPLIGKLVPSADLCERDAFGLCERVMRPFQ